MILGAVLVCGDDAIGSISSIAKTGGLVASGDGTAAGKPKLDTEGPLLKPRFGRFGVAGGLVADVAAVTEPGIDPLLNSAQRGHLRFVSVIRISAVMKYIVKKMYSCDPFARNARNASDNEVGQ